MTGLTILLSDKLFLSALLLLLLETSCTIDSLQPFPCPIPLKVIGQDGNAVDVEMQKNGSKYVFVLLGFEEGDGKVRPVVQDPDDELAKLIEEQYALSTGSLKKEPDENSEQKKATGTNIDTLELKGPNSPEKCFNQTPLKQKGQTFNTNSEPENSDRLQNKEGTDFSKDLLGLQAKKLEEFHLQPEHFNGSSMTKSKANDKSTLGRTSAQIISHNVLDSITSLNREPLSQNPLKSDIMALTTPRSSDIPKTIQQGRNMKPGSTSLDPEYNETNSGQYDVAVLERLLIWKKRKVGDKISPLRSTASSNLTQQSSSFIEQSTPKDKQILSSANQDGEIIYSDDSKERNKEDINIQNTYEITGNKGSYVIQKDFHYVPFLSEPNKYGDDTVRNSDGNQMYPTLKKSDISKSHQTLKDQNNMQNVDDRFINRHQSNSERIPINSKDEVVFLQNTNTKQTRYNYTQRNPDVIQRNPSQINRQQSHNLFKSGMDKPVTKSHEISETYDNKNKMPQEMIPNIRDETSFSHQTNSYQTPINYNQGKPRNGSLSDNENKYGHSVRTSEEIRMNPIPERGSGFTKPLIITDMDSKISNGPSDVIIGQQNYLKRDMIPEVNDQKTVNRQQVNSDRILNQDKMPELQNDPSLDKQNRYGYTLKNSEGMPMTSNSYRQQNKMKPGNLPDNEDENLYRHQLNSDQSMPIKYNYGEVLPAKNNWAFSKSQDYPEHFKDFNKAQPNPFNESPNLESKYEDYALRGHQPIWKNQQQSYWNPEREVQPSNSENNPDQFSDPDLTNYDTDEVAISNGHSGRNQINHNEDKKLKNNILSTQSYDFLTTEQTTSETMKKDSNEEESSMSIPNSFIKDTESTPNPMFKANFQQLNNKESEQSTPLSEFNQSNTILKYDETVSNESIKIRNSTENPVQHLNLFSRNKLSFTNKNTSEQANNKTNQLDEQKSTSLINQHNYPSTAQQSNRVKTRRPKLDKIRSNKSENSHLRIFKTPTAPTSHIKITKRKDLKNFDSRYMKVTNSFTILAHGKPINITFITS